MATDNKATTAAAPAAAAPQQQGGMPKFDSPEFDAWVKDYDAGVRRFVLGYDDLHSLAASIVGADTAESVLVVGCGTGQEVLTLSGVTRAATAPAKWKVVGCDPSEKMVAIAQARCAAAGLTVTNAPADAPKPKADAKVSATAPTVELHACYTSQLPASATGFDAATSVLVMHMLADDDTPTGKKAYLQSITARLKPGARYFTVDGTVDRAGDPLFEKLFESWIAFGLSRGAPVAAIPQVRAMWAVKPGSPVSTMTEQRMKELLASVGFVDIMVVYQGLVMKGFSCRYQPTTIGATASTAAAAAAPAK